MKRFCLICLTTVALSGCAGETSSQRVSHAGEAPASGMTYDQFKYYSDKKAQRDGGVEAAQRSADAANGNSALQKRFMSLDRDNNGRLSPNEFNGY